MYRAPWTPPPFRLPRAYWIQRIGLPILVVAICLLCVWIGWHMRTNAGLVFALCTPIAIGAVIQWAWEGLPKRYGPPIAPPPPVAPPVVPLTPREREFCEAMLPALAAVAEALRALREHYDEESDRSTTSE